MAINEQNKWQAEQDARTLKDANDIKKDPGRIANAQEYVADLKAGVGGQKTSTVQQPKGAGQGVKAGLEIR